MISERSDKGDAFFVKTVLEKGVNVIIFQKDDNNGNVVVKYRHQRITRREERGSYAKNINRYSGL